MTDTTTPPAVSEPPGLAEVRELAHRLLDAHTAFYAIANRNNPVTDLRPLLTSGNVQKQRAALLLARFVDWSLRLALVPEIYALTDNDELVDQALWLLGTLPVRPLRQRLTPLLFERLEEPERHNDPNTWRSTAQLLERLSLSKDLKRVAMLALSHENLEVRKVGRHIVTDMM